MKTLLESLGSIARASGDGLVLRPRSERELASALMVLRDRQVALGEGVTLDRSGFDRLGRLDDRSMTIEVGAGVSVRELEARVNQQKLTLGALAPAAWEATVGAMVEDSALGFRVIVPGRLEPLAVRVTGVLPDGATVISSPGPRHAVGPDLASLLIGGGGVLGLVTSATLRLMPQPADEQRRLFSFPSHADALEALRESLSAGASFARVVIRGRAGRTIAEVTVRGSAGQLEREQALIARCAESASGRFEGQGREAEVDGVAHEVTWSDVASALAQGASVELFRVSLSTVIARGVAVRSFLPPSPLMRSLKDVFDRARVLGRLP